MEDDGCDENVLDVVVGDVDHDRLGSVSVDEKGGSKFFQPSPKQLGYVQQRVGRGYVDQILDII